MSLNLNSYKDIIGTGSLQCSQLAQYISHFTPSSLSVVFLWQWKEQHRWWMHCSVRDFLLKTFPKCASLSKVSSIRMQGLDQTHVGRCPGGPGSLSTTDSWVTSYWPLSVGSTLAPGAVQKTDDTLTVKVHMHLSVCIFRSKFMASPINRHVFLKLQEDLCSGWKCKSSNSSCWMFKPEHFINLYFSCSLLSKSDFFFFG